MSSICPKTRDLRIFGLSVGTALTAVAFFLVALDPLRIGMFIVGGALFVLGVIRPGLLRGAYGPWMKMAEIMGAIMTRILLTVFYFTLLVPFTLMRMSDPLRLKLGRDMKSFWEPARQSENTIERFRRPF